MMLEEGILSEEEIGALRASLANAPARDRLLVELMLSHGMRMDEVLAIRNKDVLGNGGEETIVLGAGPKERSVRIAGDLAQMLSARAKGERGFVFDGYSGALTKRRVQKIVQKIGEDAKLGKRLTPKMLRNTFAIRHLRKGGKLHELKERMGYSSMLSVLKYAAALGENKEG